MKHVALLGLIVAVLLSGCYPTTPMANTPAASEAPAPSRVSESASAAAAVPIKVTLAMGYIPSVQFAPFYVAQARGYFKDAGLDVTFRYGLESDLLKLVGTNALQFMIGSGEEVILGRSQGLPVRYVMRWYRRFPVVLFAKADKGIKTPADLVGKTVGISMLSGASYVAWEALAYAGGLDVSKVNLQVIGFTQAATLSQDRVDAALDYVVNGPVQLRLAGQDVTTIAVSDFIDLPSNGLITNEKMIQEKPQLVQALVTAALRGLADTLADPDAAFDFSLKAVPEAGGDQAKVSRAIFDESLKLWQAAQSDLGRSDPAAWEKAAVFMRKMGLIQTDVTAADLYTNEFVGR
ncbi:MAG: ABC transporter substrate-binding protein [Chloroflexi bacterium]|nr:ABC transporter substrate-binding protein [Chloroflexota bacterium]